MVMARYPSNFTQNLDPEELASLPELAVYEGNDPDLKHLVGVVMRTADVEKLVYVGERENVWVERDDTRWRPWLGCALLELDEHGKVKLPPPGPELPTYGPRAMSTGDLARVGLTDQALDDLAQRLLGESWEPDRPGPSDARRKLFDRVMLKAMGS